MSYVGILFFQLQMFKVNGSYENRIYSNDEFKAVMKETNVDDVRVVLKWTPPEMSFKFVLSWNVQGSLSIQYKFVI